MKCNIPRSKHLLNSFTCAVLGRDVLSKWILSQCSSRFLLAGLEGWGLAGKWRQMCWKMHWGVGEEALKSMLKIVPQTSSLPLGFESPGAQKHQNYNSLVRNTTLTSAAKQICPSITVCAHTAEWHTKDWHFKQDSNKNFGQLYFGNMQKYFGSCPTLPYLDLFHNTVYKGILKV